MWRRKCMRGKTDHTGTHRVVDEDVAVVAAARDQLVVGSPERDLLGVRRAVAVPHVPAPERTLQRQLAARRHGNCAVE